MTEYDAHKLLEEEENKNRVSALHATNGELQIYFKDGTIEVWKQSKWTKQLKKIRSRSDK